MGEARNFVPDTVRIAADFRYLRAEGAAVGFGWQAQDLHPSGACGDAAAAELGFGVRSVAAKAEGVAALMAEVARFAWDG